MAASVLHELLSESACTWALRLGFSAVAMNSETAGGSGICDAVAAGTIRGKNRVAVFESKVSRSDFKADLKKIHRKYGQIIRGVSEHWYVTPKGLLKVEEIPEGWGLLEADARGKVWVTKRATIHDITPSAFHKQLLDCARACSQKYVTSRNSKWISGAIELDPSTYENAKENL